MTFGQGLNSQELNKTIQEAAKIAKERRAYTIDPAHVLLALIQSKDPKITKALRDAQKRLEEKLESYLGNQPKAGRNIEPSPNATELQSIFTVAQHLAKKENTEIEQIHLLYAALKNNAVREALEGEDISGITSKIEAKEERDKPGIEDFAVDMVQQAREGIFDPVIGRDKEIRTVIEVLTKKIKSNAMLLGEPGVGKTAIANGIAQLIASNQAPGLTDCKLYSVDLGALVAGAMYQGQFEERMKTLIKEAEDSQRKIILFIDEIHMVLGAGKSSGAMNAANLLKPGLASGAIRCIGATTCKEYKEYIEKDPAFERRFVSINVLEPSVEDTVTILRGLRERFESFHGLNILNETLECAAEMGDRYLTGGHMPDTAITLLDAACASVKVALESEPAEVLSIKSKIWAAELEKTAIQSDQQRDTEVNNEQRLEKVDRKIKRLKESIAPIEKEYGERMEHIVKRRKLKTKLEALKTKLLNAQRDKNHTLAYDIQEFAIPEIEKEVSLLGADDQKICIRPEHIATVVSNITGIPAKRLTVSENTKLLQMEERLNHRVIGQTEAIKALTDAIIRSRAGFARTNRPIGSFLFLGPTGVGKTQLAKSLAFEMFDDEAALIRLDMSEYLEEHSVSRLIGAPPGYIGYETGGYLTEKVRNRPYSIILIDEIEKAHKRVANIFLQILDEGRLTDGHGRTIDFTNTVVLMTSNLGSGAIIGGESKERTLEAAKNFFPPEFINRLDGIEIFNPLDYENLKDIISIYIGGINQRLAKERMSVSLDDPAVEAIIASAYTPEYGARPMQRYIESTIITDISKIYLTSESVKGMHLRITGTGSVSAETPPFYASTSFAYYQ
ncbi:ATP-dependent Clp protease ATP-binding subunit ClpB [Nematocida displodere]|uniref:ATP-dependent Clp protease ATP-binding subunit ClpB n=1 Tax=Nematocida displodere TaxID=1805483 RepID=A0A177ECK0_9MICR|nr:ATP-dependent Clp protease ATP-binding subunit ClpB [Nematocida displodere]